MRLSREDLGTLTVGALVRRRRAGVLTLLDFACTGEHAIVAHERQLGRHLVVLDAPNATLENLAEEPWVAKVAGDDPRFAEPLGAIWPGTVAEVVLFAPPRTKQTLLDNLPALRARLAALEALSLEEALAFYVDALSGPLGDDRRSTAMLARFGLGGEPPLTLQAVKDLTGLSRERIRQLEGDARNRRSRASAQPYLPQLDAALTAIAEAAPLSGAGAARVLIDGGIAKAPFSAESLASAAELCGRALPFVVVKVGDSAIVLSSPAVDAAGRLDRICGVARGLARRFGASTFNELSKDLDRESIFLPNEDLALILAESQPQAVVAEGWFWYVDGQTHTTFVQTTMRMLSVTTPLSVASLRDGLRRRYAHKRLPVPPPLRVLERVYRSHPSFEVDAQGMVSPAEGPTAHCGATTTSQRLVEILQGAPDGILDRSSLMEAARAAGLNLRSVALYTSYSECIERLGAGVYAARGTRVSREAVIALQERVGIRRRSAEPVSQSMSSDPWLLRPSTGIYASMVVHGPPLVRGPTEEGADEMEEAAPCAQVTSDSRGTGWVWINVSRRR